MFNVAVVGCGQISRAHLTALAHVPNARVVALCDSDLDRARGVAALAAGAKLHSTLDDASLTRDRHGPRL